MFPRSLPISAGRRDEATRPMVPLFPDRPKISRFALGLGIHSIMREKGVGCQTMDRRGCRSLGYSGQLNFILFLLMWQPASQPYAPSDFDIHSLCVARSGSWRLAVVRLPEYLWGVFF